MYILWARKVGLTLWRVGILPFSRVVQAHNSLSKARQVTRNYLMRRLTPIFRKIPGALPCSWTPPQKGPHSYFDHLNSSGYPGLLGPLEYWLLKKQPQNQQKCQEFVLKSRKNKARATLWVPVFLDFPQTLLAIMGFLPFSLRITLLPPARKTTESIPT